MDELHKEGLDFYGDILYSCCFLCISMLSFRDIICFCNLTLHYFYSWEKQRSFFE